MSERVISCWALRDRVLALRSVVGKPGIGDEQLPAAESAVRAERAKYEHEKEAGRG